MRPKLNIVGNVAPVSDKNPVRASFLQKYVNRDAINWMRALGEVLDHQKVLYRAKAKEGPLDPSVTERDASIDLLACFVDKVEPTHAQNVWDVLQTNRLGMVLLLSHFPLNVDQDWLWNFRSVALVTKKSAGGIEIPHEHSEDDDTVQIRELTYFKSIDMKNLVQKLVDRRLAG